MALRRVFVVSLAVVFFAVGFAHVLQHLDVPVSTIALQAETGPADDVPDEMKKPLLVEHCFGCTMMAILVNGNPVVAFSTVSGLAPQLVSDVKPHIPSAVTRPPIVLI